MEAAASTTEKSHTLWPSLVEAVRGSHQDYTTGSLNRAILLLAVPMVLEMVLESLFGVVDIFWVGRLGANVPVWLNTEWLINRCRHLEHVHLEWNRWGFPEGCEYDSCCVLEAEASMHGTSLFA